MKRLNQVLLLGMTLLAIVVFTLPSRATDLPLGGGNGGDTDYRFVCPPDAYVTGFIVHLGAWVDQLTIICKHLDRIAWELTGEVDAVNVSVNRGLPTIAGRSLGARYPTTRSCQKQSVLDGANFYFLKTDTPVLDFFYGYCSHIVTPEFTTEFIVAEKNDDVYKTPTVLSPESPFDRPKSYQSCPSGEWAIGIYGRYGLFVDSIGLICGPRGESEQERLERIGKGAQPTFRPGAVSPQLQR